VPGRRIDNLVGISQPATNLSALAVPVNEFVPCGGKIPLAVDIDDLENEAKLGAYRVISDLEANAPLLKTGRAKCIGRHKRVTIDIGERTIVCRECCAPVDPILFMARAADEWKVWAGKVNRMRAECGDLAVRVQDGKRKLKSLDGKIARREKKLED
jgi:hypothetical protein